MSSLIRKAQASWRGTVDGHTELQHVISSEKQAKSTFKSWIRAQSEVSGCLERWASREENPAIQDLFVKLLELDKVWAEVQQLYVEQIKDYRLALESILHQELTADSARKHKQKCEKIERGCEKEIQRLQKKGESTVGVEARLRQARSLRELADASANTANRDLEHFKNRVVVESIDRFADAQIAMFEKGIAIFRAQKDLVRVVPPSAYHLSEQAMVPYPGTDRTTRILLEVTEHVRAIELLAAREITRSPMLGAASPMPASDLDFGGPGSGRVSRSQSVCEPPRRGVPSRTMSVTSDAPFPPDYRDRAPTVGSRTPSSLRSLSVSGTDTESPHAVPPRPSAAALGYTMAADDDSNA